MIASLPCPNRGRGRGTCHPSSAAAANVDCQAMPPRVTMPVTSVVSSSSRLNHAPQVRFSVAVGLFSGGAQCTGETILTPLSRRPSAACLVVPWLARPARCSAAMIQSPERSPVNILPVRFPPCAAGANPTTSRCGLGSPKEGTGRPQYGSVANARRFSAATRSRHRTSLGHARHTDRTACSCARSAAPAASLRTCAGPRAIGVSGSATSPGHPLSGVTGEG